ncbi:MAG TPA: DUF362 domain-containing protein [Candidatus Hydrogenedentes bacterium]|nr:DUF362 domain-containing protein [Candidatus Hydrogenedentota bacterium]
MSSLTRRDFLHQTAITAGALSMGWGASFAQEAGPADMAIARWAGATGAEAPLADMAVKLTEQAIAAIGGIGRFVRRGDVVWVKPNIAWDRTPEQAANTNPDVVKTLVRLCLEAGAKTVKVGDNPCDRAESTYVKSGIAAAAREAGAEVEFLDRSRFRTVAVGGDRLKEIPIYPGFLDADLVINVPVAKHHRATTVTLCMKNYMGVVEERRKFHQDLPATIRDITAYMKPRLCVLDALRVLTGNGPTGGDLADVKAANLIAAGVDIVALDAFGSELLGHKPEDIGTVKAGFDAGLGRMDYRSLALKELEVV